MKPPVISVIIPVYNSASYLPDSLESLRAQTFEEFEVIIVDDASTDNGLSIADHYAGMDSRFRIYRNERNSGQYASRRNGILISSGKYIGFMDSDDCIAPDMLATLYHNIIQAKAQISVVNMQFVSGCKIGRRTDSSSECRNFSGPEAFMHTFSDVGSGAIRMGVSVCNKLFERCLVLDHMAELPPELRWGEDTFFTGIMLANAQTVVADSSGKYFYNVKNINSISRSKDIKLHIYQIKSLTFLKSHLKSTGCFQDDFADGYYRYTASVICQGVFSALQIFDDDYNKRLLTELNIAIANNDPDIFIFLKKNSIGRRLVPCLKALLNKNMGSFKKRLLILKLYKFFLRCTPAWLSRQYVKLKKYIHVKS